MSGPVPTWSAPSNTTQAQASHINQFFGPHPTVFINAGRLDVSVGVTNNATIPTYVSGAQWVAQEVTPGAIDTYVTVEFNMAAGTASDTTVGLQGVVSGAPSGTFIAGCSITLPSGFLTGTASSFILGIPFPNPSSIVAATSYFLVVEGTSSATDIIQLAADSTATPVAQVSATGTGGWTAATAALILKLYTGTDHPTLFTVEDGGLEWTYKVYGNGYGAPMTEYGEFTAGPGEVAVSRVVATVDGYDISSLT